MAYNEFETRALGKIKILAHIDNRALLEKMYDTPEKYIIAKDFNIKEKSWAFGSYYNNFQNALEEFTERVLGARNLQSTREKITLQHRQEEIDNIIEECFEDEIEY